MLHQGISDLDFNAYFDVTNQLNTNQNPQQQINNVRAPPPLLFNETNQAIHPSQQSNIPQFNTAQHPYYIPQTSQPPYEMLNWYHKDQQQQPQQQQQQQQFTTSIPTPNGLTPNNTVSSCARPDYFLSAAQANSVNPAFASFSPRLGSGQPQCQQQKSQNNLADKFTDTVIRNDGSRLAVPESNNNMTISNFNPSAPLVNNGLPTPISDVMFPETPNSRNSDGSVSSQNNPDEPNLSNAFAAIDNWRKSYDEASSKDDAHETRHWRKTRRSDSSSSNISSIVAHTVAAVAAKSASSPDPNLETGHHLKKVAHNAIERRYRNNINDRIQELRNVVPALYQARDFKKPSEDDDSSDDEEGTKEVVDGVEVAKKLNKATILHKATEYIHHLKHVNELAERENQVLQQILAQMPGGSKVLARFQVQKYDFQKAEQQRLISERKELLEREKLERQKMLRERAAQRAALAELLPKPARRPYRRRAKKQEPSAEVSANETGNDQSPSDNKAFLAIFLCLAIVSPLSFENTAAQPYYNARALSYQPLTARTLPGDLSVSYYSFLIKLALVFMFLSFAVIRLISSVKAFKRNKVEL